MDCHSIEEESMQFTCVGAMFIAAKFDWTESSRSTERSAYMPSRRRFLALLEYAKDYEKTIKDEFLHLEAGLFTVCFGLPFNNCKWDAFQIMLLTFFKWNIFIPTPWHYTEILLLDALDLAGDFIQGKSLLSVASEDILDCLIDFTHYFLDISMQVSWINYF